MTVDRFRTSILVAGMLVALFGASPAQAQVLDGARLKCAVAIPKNAQKFLVSKLKLIHKCRNANLKDGSCATPDPQAIAKIDGKLTAAIDKACSFTPATVVANLAAIGFPGPCTDANPGDGFTLADLKDCIQSSHEDFIAEVLDIQYDTTLPPTLPSADLKCQAEVAKQSLGLTSCILKNVAKCRDALLKGKALGVPPDFCAIDYVKASTAIGKCEAKLTAGIAKKCTPTQVAGLKTCTPDQTTPADAATCLIDSHTVRTDTPEIAVPPDLIDHEYAVRGGLCGDNVVNNLNEECDGTDDSACPGECGTASTPDGFFACLCKTKPRAVIVHDGAADTDNGWTGLSSDGDVVTGSGYIVDLYDCDMTGLCNVGPSCSLPPHSPCGVPAEAASGTTSDSICAGLGQGTCRKERTATGPHCYLDPQKKCSESNPNDPVCNAPGDFCQSTLIGAPVGQAAGGIPVCNVSILNEDVTGTMNIVTGHMELKVRQRAVVRNAITQDKPCPVCGGFCGVSRERCEDNSDCGPGDGLCVTAAVCSDGLRKDKSCRPNPPFGGEMPFFGITSMDCPPDPNFQTLLTTTGGIDVDTDPRGTGSYTLLPSFPCTAAGFNNNACLGGTSEGRPCTTASECPGGTCTPQCFCPGQERPNTCLPACVGGGSDAAPCDVDADCPGGFCHRADCRVDPSDTDSNQEGICTQSAPIGNCSITTFAGCSNNGQCAPPACPTCEVGETCVLKNRACMVNSGITRTGTPGFPDQTLASVYCVPANFSAINVTAGFSGPGALIQPQSVLVVP
jgi:hypothetical protein